MHALCHELIHIDMWPYHLNMSHVDETSRIWMSCDPHVNHAPLRCRQQQVMSLVIYEWFVSRTYSYRCVTLKCSSRSWVWSRIYEWDVSRTHPYRCVTLKYSSRSWVWSRIYEWDVSRTHSCRCVMSAGDESSHVHMHELWHELTHIDVRP